jgi:hypothetical protein
VRATLQLAMSSPLLDARLFLYDDKVQLPLCRLRPAPEHAVRFYAARRPGRLAFKIEPSSSESAGTSTRARRGVRSGLHHVNVGGQTVRFQGGGSPEDDHMPLPPCLTP